MRCQKAVFLYLLAGTTDAFLANFTKISIFIVNRLRNLNHYKTTSSIVDGILQHYAMRRAGSSRKEIYDYVISICGDLYHPLNQTHWLWCVKRNFAIK